MVSSNLEMGVAEKQLLSSVLLCISQNINKEVNAHFHKKSTAIVISVFPHMLRY